LRAGARAASTGGAGIFRLRCHSLLKYYFHKYLFELPLSPLWSQWLVVI
jgi:hypothetical protein